MKPILPSDLERLREQIRRVKGGRMDPNPIPQGADTCIDPGEIPGEISGGVFDGPAFFTGEQPEHYDAEKVLDGEVMENQWGRYFVSERFYPAHHRHGSMEISQLGEMPAELLTAISRDKIPAHDPARWAFLDTETTGLAGGTGTCAFLVGVGTIEDGGFRVRLFFMRDYDEETAMLAGLAEFLRWYDVLVTYNGKAYDVPLLETRYRMRRQWFPFERMHHLDLLHGARQLWKLRMESCRLMQLEYEILGLVREGDLPGEMAPYYFFEYLRTKQAFRLVPLFHHNVMDIVSLACLSAVVLPAFADRSGAGLRHGTELLGLARWLRRCGEFEAAAELYRRAVDAGLPGSDLFAALWERALVEKRQGRHDVMLAICEDLSRVKNDHRVAALEELAKYYEHQAKDYARALAFAETAEGYDPAPEITHRAERLRKRLRKQRGHPVLFETASR